MIGEGEGEETNTTVCGTSRGCCNGVVFGQNLNPYDPYYYSGNDEHDDFFITSARPYIASDVGAKLQRKVCRQFQSGKDWRKLKKVLVAELEWQADPRGPYDARGVSFRMWQPIYDPYIEE